MGQLTEYDEDVMQFQNKIEATVRNFMITRGCYNPHDAEELCQDIVMKLLIRVPKYYRPECNVKKTTYMYQATKNHMRNWYKNRPRIRPMSLNTETEEGNIGEIIPDRKQDPTKALDVQEAVERIEEHIIWHEGERALEVFRLLMKHEGQQHAVRRELGLTPQYVSQLCTRIKNSPIYREEMEYFMCITEECLKV